MFRVLLTSVCLFFLVSCNGQQSNQCTSKPTLPFSTGALVDSLSDAIMVVYQDKANNHWFGSRGDGVFRYDGKTLVRFTVENGLVSNDIWGIQEDKFGNIFFDTQDGVCMFNGQTFQTLTIGDSSTKPALSPANVAFKLEADDLWFKGSWNQNGALRYDGKQLQRLEFPKTPLADTLKKQFPNMTWSPYGLYSMYKDRSGAMWFGTSNVGVYRFDGKTVSRMYEDHLTNTPGGGSFGIRSIYEDRQGKFWFCNTRYRYNILKGDSTANGESFIRYRREKGIDNVKAADGSDAIYFMSIVEDNAGDLWMVTYDEGVWRYDGSTMTRYDVKNNSKDVKLYSIYKDNGGELWLGTHEDGAYKFNGSAFEKLTP